MKTPDAQDASGDLSIVQLFFLAAMLGSVWSFFFFNGASTSSAGIAMLGWALVFSFMAPGVLLHAAWSRSSDATLSLLIGCGLSWVGAALVDAATKVLLPGNAANAVFLIVWLLLGIGGLVLSRRKLASQGAPYLQSFRSLIVGGTALVLASAWLLADATFGADLNPDGYELLVATRSMRDCFLPQWPDLPGPINLGIGMVSTCFAARPFDAFFVATGEVTGAGVRIPTFLGIFMVLAATLSFRRDRSAAISLRWLVGPALGVLAVTIALCRNGGYDQLSADLASPGTTDLLALGALMALLVGVWRGSWTVIILFGVLSVLARPTPIIVLSLVGVASFLTQALSRREILKRVGGALAVCLVTALTYQWLSTDGAEESASVLSRLRFLSLTEFSRLRFLILPSGVVTAVVLFLPSKLDRTGRALLIVCWILFGFFAVQSFVSLHHFLIPMYLPVVIFWRSEFAGRRTPRIAAMFGSIAVIAVLHLAAPPQPTQLAQLSHRVAFDVQATQRPHEVLNRAAALLTIETDTVEPTTAGYRHALGRIILRTANETPLPSAEILLIPIGTEVPAGWTATRSQKGFTLCHRSGAPPKELVVNGRRFAHPLLAIPLEEQFRHIGEPKGLFDIDVRDLLPYR